MRGFVKLVLTNRESGAMLRGVGAGARVFGVLWIALLLVGCSLPLPLPTQMPVEIPGMPTNWEEIEGLMGDLGLPDLSAMEGVPGLDALSGLQTPAGAIAFQGPVEMALTPGQTIPGTDIRFVETESGGDAAQFEIAGMRAPRRVGDSLDFDGAWPGINGVTYHLRLRVYHLGSRQVRAAGVHRLVVENVQPQVGAVPASADRHVLRFPHSVMSADGAQFAGMTLRYNGVDERGAILSGLPEGEYPYRKIGDSVEWSGRLTPDLPVEYHLRLLYYQEANATLGGVVDVSLPEP